MRAGAAILVTASLATGGWLVAGESSSDSLRAPSFFASVAAGDGTTRCIQLEAAAGAQLLEAMDAEPQAEETVQVGSMTLVLVDLSPEARAAVIRGAELWSDWIFSPQPIRFRFAFGQTPAGLLGLTIINSTIGSGAAPGLAVPDALLNRMIGRDRDPALFEAEITFDTDNLGDFYFGLDGDPPADKSDFLSIVMHELGHALGITSQFRVDGVNGIVDNPLASPESFDRFAEDSFGRRIVDRFIFPSGTVQLRQALTTAPIVFMGPRAVAASGAPPVLFAPSNFSGTGSISHLDEVTYLGGSANALMTPASAQGEANLDPGPIVVGIMRDIGWSIPDPLQFAQFGAGAGLRSEIVIFNPSLTHAVRGRVQLFLATGSSLAADEILEPAAGTEQRTTGDLAFQLPPQGTLTLRTRNQDELVLGSALIWSNAEVAAVIRFDLPPNGIAGVGAAKPNPAVVAPVRRTGSLSTGVAVRNTENFDLTADVTLRDGAGNVVAGGETIAVIIPARGRIAKFIDELFPNADTISFEGSLLIVARAGRIAALVLELDLDEHKFTTLPVRPVQP